MQVRIMFAKPHHNVNSITEFNVHCSANTKFVLLNTRIVWREGCLAGTLGEVHAIIKVYIATHVDKDNTVKHVNITRNQI